MPLETADDMDITPEHALLVAIIRQAYGDLPDSIGFSGKITRY
jgi:hypothetical protein